MALAVIPARYASVRFPGKPLADRTGKPLIQHVVEQVRQAKRIERIIVATDDQRIFDAVQAFGGEAMMTGQHPNGTSRIAEVVAKISHQASEESHQATEPPSHRGKGKEAQAQSPSVARWLDGSVAGLPGSVASDMIVNVQGDEPEIEPPLIDALIAGLAGQPALAEGGAPMATLASDFADDEDPADPNIVKLVVSQTGHALYFSRSPIPCYRDAARKTLPAPPDSSNQKSGIRNQKFLKHPGLYAYRRDFLLTYVTLPPTPLEQAEQLEQLRALEHGYRIAVVKADVRHHGIDTPEQYEAFVQRYRRRLAAPHQA